MAQECSKLRNFIKINESNINVLNRKKNLLDDRIKKTEESHKILLERTSKIINNNLLIEEYQETAERRQRIGSEELAFFKGRQSQIEGYSFTMSKN